MLATPLTGAPDESSIGARLHASSLLRMQLKDAKPPDTTGQAMPTNSTVSRDVPASQVEKKSRGSSAGSASAPSAAVPTARSSPRSIAYSICGPNMTFVLEPSGASVASAPAQKPLEKAAVMPAVVPAIRPAAPCSSAVMATSPGFVPQVSVLPVGVAVGERVGGALPEVVGVGERDTVAGGDREGVAVVLREAPTECVLDAEAVRGLADVARGDSVTTGTT